MIAIVSKCFVERRRLSPNELLKFICTSKPCFRTESLCFKISFIYQTQYQKEEERRGRNDIALYNKYDVYCGLPAVTICARESEY